MARGFLVTSAGGGGGGAGASYGRGTFPGVNSSLRICCFLAWRRQGEAVGDEGGRGM
jgi:hypothetical protein